LDVGGKSLQQQNANDGENDIPESDFAVHANAPRGSDKE
jgi:hypothetical protein